MKTTPKPDPMIEPDILEMESRFEKLIIDTGSFEEVIASQKIGKNLFRIAVQQIYTKNLFLGDTVKAYFDNESHAYRIAKLVTASGNFAMILIGLQRNRSGRKVFERLSRLGVCAPIKSNIFTMSALRKKWPEIEQIVKAAKLEMRALGDLTVN